MKKIFRSYMALALSILLLVSCLSGCGGKKAKAETTKFPEAMELLTYMEVISKDTAAKFNQPITGEEAAAALKALNAEPTIKADDATVSGAALLGELVRLLGYSIDDKDAMLEKARQVLLLRGLPYLDVEEALTVEQAANIIMSALQAHTVESDGAVSYHYLADFYNVEHVVLDKYEDPFNRPGSVWVDTEKNQYITDEYVAQPVAVFGTVASWCDILDRLGFTKDDPENDQHIPKYFQNTCDGNELTTQFWKHHNGDANDSHSSCKNDFTGGQDAMLSIYQLSDYQFINVSCNTYLGVIENGELTMYGFERATYGPYKSDDMPADGVYITHHYWNSALGQGYEIVEPATVIYGTLTDGNIKTTTIDGVEYENSQTYGFGKKLTTAPVNAGKQFYFYLDRYGFILGCSSEEVGK